MLMLMLMLVMFALHGFSGILWLSKLPRERVLSLCPKTGHGNSGGNILQLPIDTLMLFFKLGMTPDARIC